MKLVERNVCTACGACMSSCPKSCITIEKDEFGFYYPEINDFHCIECGSCVKACPIHSNSYLKVLRSPISTYVLQHKDEGVLKKSTSGGAFTAIVQALWIDRTTIYGASLNKDLSVSQKRITNIDDLDSLRGSKYVESYSGDIYRLVFQDIIDGRRVIYSGTPCQIAGLYSYLNFKNIKSLDNLYTIEIVCHGVPTSLLLKKYIEYKEQKNKAKAQKIEFRSKKYSDWTNPKITIDFDNHKTYRQKSFAHDDEYMIGFCDFLCLRENCGNCFFANPKRGADFTIGDCWGIETSGVNIDYINGVSLLCINTAKAYQNFSALQQYCRLIRIDYDFLRKHNEQLNHPIVPNKKRTEFLCDLQKITFSALRKKYLKPRNYFVNILSNYLGKEMKNTIKKIIGKSPSTL